MQIFWAKSIKNHIDFAHFMWFWAKSIKNLVDFARNMIMIRI